jgi:hypothetical protein
MSANSRLNELDLIVPRATQHFQRMWEQFRHGVKRLGRAARATRQIDN